MNWAFWRRKRAARVARSSAPGRPEPDFDSGDNSAEADEAAAHTLRVRLRRRLIGACALLLAAVVIVPMALDPAPRAVPDSIPIDLPSDKTAFAPHLAAPTVPETGAPGEPTAAGAPPAAPGAAADTAAESAPESAAESAAESATAAPHAVAPAPPTDHSHSRKHVAGDPATGKIFLQAGALSHESAARELASRIAKSGLAPFVERTGTGEGVRFRVRLGPFASRSEAEHSRARLRALGVDANIVGA